MHTPKTQTQVLTIMTRLLLVAIFVFYASLQLTGAVSFLDWNKYLPVALQDVSGPEIFEQLTNELPLPFSQLCDHFNAASLLLHLGYI